MAMTKNKQRDKVAELIQRGEDVYRKEYHSPEHRFPIGFVDGPLYRTWMGDIKTLSERYFQDHPLFEDIRSTYGKRGTNPHALENMCSFLNSLYNDEEYWESSDILTLVENNPMSITTNKVFIVHGHDDAAKYEMARTLENLGLEAIILHEQADCGRTIIEKIEQYTDVAFAVVLYTECDYGRAKEDDVSNERYRARQNVVFEHGYLIGKLGRNRVCAVVKGDVETPGDISGILYTEMDEAGAWKFRLGSNMKAAGIEIDLNKLI